MYALAFLTEHGTVFVSRCHICSPTAHRRCLLSSQTRPTRRCLRTLRAAISLCAGPQQMPIAPIYAASKAALAHFVRSAAPTLARRGVRLCAVCPQPVDTPMVREMMLQGSAMPQDTGASLITPDRVLKPCSLILAVQLVGNMPGAP